MNHTKTNRLRFSYRGKRYDVLLTSINYTETLTINKLTIGHSRIWLILQNDVWRFVSDMPVCRELKHLLIRKISTCLGLPIASEALKIAEQMPVRTGFLLNAVLNVLAVKKELP